MAEKPVGTSIEGSQPENREATKRWDEVQVILQESSNESNTGDSAWCKMTRGGSKQIFDDAGRRTSNREHKWRLAWGYPPTIEILARFFAWSLLTSCVWFPLRFLHAVWLVCCCQPLKRRVSRFWGEEKTKLKIEMGLSPPTIEILARYFGRSLLTSLLFLHAVWLVCFVTLVLPCFFWGCT